MGRGGGGRTSDVMMIAHILGMPIEESLLPWASGGLGAGMLMVLASILSRMRCRRAKR